MPITRMPMYPVKALVMVAVGQGLESSALAPSSSVESRVTYNGIGCPVVTQAGYCPAHYFYCDGQANWQVA